MTTTMRLPFMVLLLLISFAAVNAILFTPALPNIAQSFNITAEHAQLTITVFLIGYTLGQLIYGPLADRFGRKPTLYSGVLLQIASCLLCIMAGFIHEFNWLIIGRCLLALGSGVGLKMTFTLVNECYEPKMASQKISYLILAFAIAPGLAVALGGTLNAHFGWVSCFYAQAVYGLLLLTLLPRLPETKPQIDIHALKIKYLIAKYQVQFNNSRLIAGGLLMGSTTSFVYLFAALAPFVAIDLLKMNSLEYGFANILPSCGLIAGSLLSAILAKRYRLESLILVGIVFATLGTLFMGLAVTLLLNPMLSLFVPMILIYFGLAFILANASSLAMSSAHDKAHGSAVMSFINMGMATFAVLNLRFFTVNMHLLPTLYLVLCGGMVIFFKWLRMQKDDQN